MNFAQTGFPAIARVEAAPRSSSAPLSEKSGGFSEHSPARAPLARTDHDIDAWLASIGQHPDAAQALKEMHAADPPATLCLAETVATLPEAGHNFLDFNLKGELGRGAFGRVFLAEQTDLAHRRVVLKISSNMVGEAKTLAQLLHTNVVPIYSVHQHGAHQAVCMPFLGATTVADVLKAIHQQGGLPSTGKMLVSTLNDRQSTWADSRLSKDTSSASKSSAVEDGLAPRPPSGLFPLTQPVDCALTAVGSRVLLDKLEGYSYVEAVLWIASRLADGLAHAHERGILHRDLKPANILLTDEGQPMLLDFNLAEDTKLRDPATAARLGGTLPYMSPEQLAAFQGVPVKLDERSDLYALGLILFELLGGCFPFPHHRGTTKKMIGPMLQDRRGPLPSLRKVNRAVSPAVEAIIHKCLQPEAGRRYASARALQEDLQRQLDHRPLVHAGEPSWRERARKWAWRHPRLSSSTSVALLAAGLLFAVGLGWWWQNESLRAVAARAQFAHFQDDVTGVQFLFNGLAADGIQVGRAKEQCKAALDQYQVLANPRWGEQNTVRYLPPAEQDQLHKDVSLLLLYLARAHLMEARAPKALPAEQRQLVDQALGFNRLAEACFVASPAPTAVFAQRADLAEQAGRREEAVVLRQQAQPRANASPFETFLTAREMVTQGRYQDALPLLQQLTRDEPKNVHAWFLLARSHDGLAQDEEAIRAYTAAVALWPRSAQVVFNRGLAFLRRGDYKSSVLDFTKALELEPDHGETLVNRALAYHGLKKYREAESDLTASLHAGAAFARVYYLRAKMREGLGNAKGARADREEGLRHTPKDEVGWTTRGYANLGNPKAALADFDKALDLNPRYLPALTNKAHVLAELLDRNQDSIKVLDAILDHYPDHVASRASRGVLYARLGKRAEAQQDAADALRRRNEPSIQYQVAGIFALTAKDNPADFREALRLLSTALRGGYGFDWLDNDPDLNPIRASGEFRRLLAAAKTLQEAK